MRRPTLAAVLLLAALPVALLAGPTHVAAAADTDDGGKNVPVAASAPSEVVSPKVPSMGPSAQVGLGHQVVRSGQLSDPANSQVSGVASCPSGTKVVGGGAVISSSSLEENLNGSLPATDGLSWQVYVNNASSTDGTFYVYAVCVKRTIKDYTVVVGSGNNNPSGTQKRATAVCPSGTRPIGGGGFGSSLDTGVNINSIAPGPMGWTVFVNNGSTGRNTAFARAICGRRPPGFQQVRGDDPSIAPGTQGFSTATCPSGKVALSAGSTFFLSSTAANLNSTFPLSGTGWRVYQNNGDTAAHGLEIYLNCADL